MGLKADIENAIDSVMTALGDLGVTTATYHRLTSQGTYNPSTNTYGTTFTTSTIEVLFYRAQEDKQNWRKVVVDIAKVIIPGSQVAFVPQEQDYLTISGVKYEIYNVKRLPSDVGFILQIRAP